MSVTFVAAVVVIVWAFRAPIPEKEMAKNSRRMNREDIRREFGE
jgi:hypothetical protein